MRSMRAWGPLQSGWGGMIATPEAGSGPLSRPERAESRGVWSAPQRCAQVQYRSSTSARDALELTLARFREQQQRGGRHERQARLALGAADSLDATARLHLRDAKLDPAFRADSVLAAPIAGAVEAVTDLEISVSARGTTSDYRMEIASNADRILSQAVGGMRRQTVHFERTLREEILGRTRGPLAELTRGEGELAALSGLLRERTHLGEQALDVKPKTLKDQLKKLQLRF